MKEKDTKEPEQIPESCQMLGSDYHTDELLTDHTTVLGEQTGLASTYDKQQSPECSTGLQFKTEDVDNIDSEGIDTGGSFIEIKVETCPDGEEEEDVKVFPTGANATDEPVLKCTHCDSSFISTVDLGTHTSFCEMMIRTQDSLRIPDEEISNVFSSLDSRFSYQQCSETSTASENGDIHEMINENPIIVLSRGICEICAMSFDGTLPHVCVLASMNNSGKNHKCHVCSKLFRSKKSLSEHSATHGGGARPYKCEFCDKTYLSYNGMVLHWMLHMKSCNCEMCNKAFTIRLNLDNCTTVHSGVKTNWLESLEEDTLRAQTVLITKHDTAQDEGIGVEDCKVEEREEMSDHTSADREENSTASTAIRRYMCEICELCFTTLRLRKQHDSIHRSDLINMCKFCEFRNMNIRRLVVHFKKLHPDVVAGGTVDFKDVSTMARTKEEVAQLLKPKARECKVCFKSVIHMSSHMKVRHPFVWQKNDNEVQPISCETCGQACPSRDYLQFHMKKHGKPHICNICGKAFHATYNLKQHMNKHMGLKPYICELCGKSFLNKKTWKHHELEVHNTDIIYCKFCAFGTRTVYRLEIHCKKVHPDIVAGGAVDFKDASTMTGTKEGSEEFLRKIKPYKCKECSNRFTHISTLQTHMSNHHPWVPFSGKERAASRRDKDSVA